MDSAGGSIKTARDSRFQGVLPLRGKPLNVEGQPITTVLQNAEFKALLVALGCGFGDSFDMKKLNYHKIIITADADSDGMHITSLLLTFFARFMPELIHNGNIYVSCPPLYGVQLKNSKSDKLMYFWDAKEMNDTMAKKGLTPNQYTAYYYKGLGELSAQQLYDSCLDPKERILKQVHMNDAAEVDEVIRKLMGSDAKAKRDFLTTGEL